MKSFLLSLIFLFNSWVAQALTLPALSSPVIDQAGLLSASQKNELENQIYQFREKHLAQIQVLIVPDLQGETIESAAIQIFDQWKLGDAKRDDGLLMLFAMGEKKMRIEVGQGLEGSVPDVIAKRIIADIMRPYFQQGQFYTGVKFGVLAVQSAITGDQSTQLGQNPPSSNIKKKSRGLDIYVFGFIFLIWLIIFIISPSTGIHILLSVLSSRGGGGSRSSSRGWGGGGGSSSGGGASGSW